MSGVKHINNLHQTIKCFSEYIFRLEGIVEINQHTQFEDTENKNIMGFSIVTTG